MATLMTLNILCRNWTYWNSLKKLIFYKNARKLYIRSEILSRSTRWLATTPLSGDTHKKVFSRDKPHFNIGTIGHVDHGKSTLTAAITKVLSDQNKAQFRKHELERVGTTSINTSRVEYMTDKRHYIHIDCPGHVDYTKNMITGTSQMDGAILVIAATDGAMPQTMEHLILAKQLGVDNIIVYINKVDVADNDMVKLVEMEIKEILTSYGFKSKSLPVICGSALCALEGTNSPLGKDSVLKLLDAIDEYIPTPIRELDKPFLLPVENVFSVPGKGTIITGRLERGKIKKGVECEIAGYNKMIKTNITGVEMFHHILEHAEAGDQLDLIVRGIKRDEIRRGMIVSALGTCKAHDHIEAQVYVLNEKEGNRSSKPIMTNSKPIMFARTWDCTVQVSLIEKEMLNQGEDDKLHLKLIKPMVLEKGFRFILRDQINTIGVGVITQLLSPLSDLERDALTDKGAKKKLVQLQEQEKIKKKK